MDIKPLLLLLAPCLLLGGQGVSPSITGGVWMNYRYVTDSGADADRDAKTYGDVTEEALLIYIDHRQEGTPWSFSAEWRMGSGAFTDPGNNATGDNTVLHKAWVGYDFSPEMKLRIGKSQVPFGWKTVNNWPGDMLLGGYGDQMDVGVKLSRTGGTFPWEIAYCHADDWGETSTDTTDDGGHWGSADTYRKIQTVAGTAGYLFAPGSTLYLSAQGGKLEDLTAAAVASGGDVSGSHRAINLWYKGEYGPFYAKAQVIDVWREIPNVTEEVKNQRAALELGYTEKEWFYYFEAMAASTSTDGNDADPVTAFSPGFSYDYGPGWFYVEYLTQTGGIDRNGDVTEGDFSALYFSVDYYF